jgi:predicted metal-dependent hydrolase
MDKTPEHLTYTVDYRDIKYPRLEFKTGTLLLVLPKNYQNPAQLLTRHESWINRKNSTIKRALQESKAKSLNMSRTAEELKKVVEETIKKYQGESSAKEIDRVFYRKMKTKWASCSPKNNLTINTLLRHLPKGLIEYVIFHEMTHLTQKKHNEAFWKKIGTKVRDYQEKERELLVYWFLIQK